MKKSNYLTIQYYSKLDSFYQNKSITDILTPGLFGIVIHKDDIASDKFPMDIIQNGDTDKIREFCSAFYITPDGTLIYDKGGWDEVRNFYMVTICPEEYEDKHPNTILYVFNGCASFNQTYNLLVDIVRYSDVREQRVEYAHPKIPHRMSKKQIEEVLGYSIIIED